MGRLQTNLKDSLAANAERMVELKRFCRSTLDSITIGGVSKISSKTRQKASMEEHVEESETMLQLRQEFEELQNFSRLVKNLQNTVKNSTERTFTIFLNQI